MYDDYHTLYMILVGFSWEFWGNNWFDWFDWFHWFDWLWRQMPFEDRNGESAKWRKTGLIGWIG
ncbi:MAG TPA: hypothetical protein ACFCUC_03520, partial [Desulfobacterales bacterium]